MSTATGETTSISSIDTTAGVLRYRGRDVGELISRVRFEEVWGLLVDGEAHPALPPAEPFPFTVRTGDFRVDTQTALAQLAPVWGYRSVLEIARPRLREDLARATVLAFSYLARTARGEDVPAVAAREIDAAPGLAGRFLTRWHGSAPAEQVTAVDSYLTAVAEHGFTPETWTARLGAARGADVAACLSAAFAVSSGALGGGLGGHALAQLDAAEAAGDVDRAVTGMLDRGEPVWAVGHSVWLRDPRSLALHGVCARLGVPRLDAAEAFERAAVAAVAERAGDAPVPRAANFAFWGAVLLDFAGVPARMMPALFACARAAGWSAHILEQVDSLAR